MLMMSPDTYDGVHPNVSIDVGRSRRAMGRTQPDHGIGIDLQNARAKTATGSLTNTLYVRHMNEGRRGGMPRKLTLMSIRLAEFP
jgi:hypothetical protein